MVFFKALELWWKREKKNVALHRFKKNWRKINADNDTSPDGIYDLNKISVGKATYGIVKVVHHGVDDFSVSIGSYCSIAKGVEFVVDGEHDISGLMTYPVRAIFSDGPSSISRGPIIVGHNVWLGRNSTIMSGVRVGDGAVVAAGAIVTKDVPPYSVVGGVPARVIKYRCDEAARERLKHLDYSRIGEDILREKTNLFTSSLGVDAVERILDVL